jgi:hypothetical protein
VTKRKFNRHHLDSKLQTGFIIGLVKKESTSFLYSPSPFSNLDLSTDVKDAKRCYGLKSLPFIESYGTEIL